MKIQNILMCVLVSVFVVCAYIIMAIVSKRKNDKYKNEMSEGDFVVRIPKYSSVIIPIGTFFLLSCFIWLNIAVDFKQLIGLDMFFICMIAFMIAFGFIMNRQSTLVIGQNIIYTPFFGKTKEFKFSDIQYLSHQSSLNASYFAVIGYDNMKMFTLYPTYSGANRFLERVKELGIDIKYN